ncbi:MAG: CHRD domain-containing protein [Pseudomonadota bacterium]
MKRIAIAAALSATLGAATIAQAETFDLTSSIDGPQAGTSSGATGSATLTYDDVTGEFSWDITWSPLEGDITVAHFHGPAAPGVNAGVQVNIGAISGLTSPSIGSAIIDAGQAADLLAGLWYINIHSTIEPGGEIRGQVELAPAGTARDYSYEGAATLCTGTCDSFESLGGPGGAINTTPSDLTGDVNITAAAGGSFGFDDIDPGYSFEVVNTAAPMEAAIFAPDADPRCDGLDPGALCNAPTANPLPLDPSIAALRADEPTQGTTTGGTIDGSGDIASGTMLFEFTQPPFNNNGAWVILDLATGAAEVCLFYPTAGCIPGATQAVVFAGAWTTVVEADSDGDGVGDSTDNCRDVANADQRDTDGDNIGNICDQDLSGNCVVSFEDLGALKAVFFTNDPDADFNGSGSVSFDDLGLMKAAFFGPPGPSAQGCDADG